MTRHFSTFVLAAILTVAAITLISSAFAADYEKRVEFEKSEVCAADSPWNLIVEKVIPEEGQAFGNTDDNNAVKEADMPRTSVGRFFGGAWGTDGFQPFMFGSGRWRLWEVNETVPGWRVNLGKKGLFLHAQKGDEGTAFVFVGAIPAGSSQREAVLTANSLNRWLDVNGEFWSKFDEAVAVTGTGKKAEKSYAALAAMGVTWDKDGKPIFPKSKSKQAAATQVAKQEKVEKKAGSDGEVGLDKIKHYMPLAVGAILLVVFIWVIVQNFWIKPRREKIKARERTERARKVATISDSVKTPSDTPDSGQDIWNKGESPFSPTPSRDTSGRTTDNSPLFDGEGGVGEQPTGDTSKEPVAGGVALENIELELPEAPPAGDTQAEEPADEGPSGEE